MVEYYFTAHWKTDDGKERIFIEHDDDDANTKRERSMLDNSTRAEKCFDY